MNKQPEKITEILKNAREYSVSEKKDAQIRNELNSLRHNKPTPVTGGYFISLTNVVMSNYKKFAAVVAALAIVAVVGLSGVLQTPTTYASHLENAEQALQELQAMQNEGADLDAAQVRELVQEIMQETNAALALAEQEQEGEQIQKALQEVKRVQEKSMNMFKNHEGGGGDSVGEALQEAEQQHERVRKMLGEQSGEMVQEQNQEQKKVHSGQ
jgi:cytochrome c556